jgi:hypothetical protein
MNPHCSIIDLPPFGSARAPFGSVLNGTELRIVLVVWTTHCTTRVSCLLTTLSWALGVALSAGVKEGGLPPTRLKTTRRIAPDRFPHVSASGRSTVAVVIGAAQPALRRDGVFPPQNPVPNRLAGSSWPGHPRHLLQKRSSDLQKNLEMLRALRFNWESNHIILSYDRSPTQLVRPDHHFGFALFHRSSG